VPTGRRVAGLVLAYLTYSTTARGLEFMMSYYGFLDRAPAAVTRMT
jgi:predicted dithiol-disulfide oxidoreductase (DUF899 family)